MSLGVGDACLELKTSADRIEAFSIGCEQNDDV